MQKKTIVAMTTVAVVVVLVILSSIASSVQAEQRTSRTEASVSLRQNAQLFSKQLSKAFVVIGHRGNSSQAPENTLAAINQAFAIGCGMVEVDVHLSRDGVPMVIHDETVDRTTNGRGMVSQLTLAQLKTLDAGSWKNAKYAHERIPTLAEALQAAKGKGRLLLDLKVDGLGRPIADVIHSLSLSNKSVAVAAWSPEQTDDFVKCLPQAYILSVCEAPPSTWKSDFFKRQIARGITGFDLGGSWSTEFVAAAHAHGMPVYAYTINDEQGMRWLIDIGVDGIETDVPLVIVRLMNEIRRQRK
jgi:glycerophosphoryl diester phosphodiesterase